MDGLDQVTTHYIGQNLIEGKGFGLKVLIITLTFFKMKNQYNGLIHTNLVVLVISTVPYSYQDFLSTAIAVGFRTGISEGKYFQESRQAFPEK